MHSLDGLVVAVTSSRRANELVHLIESYGGKPYLAPTVGIEVSGAIGDVLHRFLNDELDAVIFLTGPGTESIIAAAKEFENELLEKLRGIPLVIARSSKPKTVLAKHGIAENVRMPSEATFGGILKLFGEGLTNKTVGIFWHGSRENEFVDSLEKLGARAIREYLTYSYSQELKQDGADLLKTAGFKKLVPPDGAKIRELIEDVTSGSIDAITFTSPPSVENLFAASLKLSKSAELVQGLNKIIVVSIGPSTTKNLIDHGVRVTVEPEEYRMGKMVDALNEYVKEKRAG